jgi:hypothetical protein
MALQTVKMDRMRTIVDIQDQDNVNQTKYPVEIMPNVYQKSGFVTVKKNAQMEVMRKIVVTTHDLVIYAKQQSICVIIVINVLLRVSYAITSVIAQTAVMRLDVLVLELLNHPQDKSQ